MTYLRRHSRTTPNSTVDRKTALEMYRQAGITNTELAIQSLRLLDQPQPGVYLATDVHESIAFDLRRAK